MWREDREEGKKTLSELENKNADVVLFQKHILLIKSMENQRLVGGPAGVGSPQSDAAGPAVAPPAAHARLGRWAAVCARTWTHSALKRAP